MIAALALAALMAAPQGAADLPLPPLFSGRLVDSHQPHPAQALVSADLDADGNPDLVSSTGPGWSSTGPGWSSVSVLLGDGQGGLRWNGTVRGPQTATPAWSPGDVAVLDVDGDGRLDVVTSGAWTDFGGALHVYPGDGLGGLGPAYEVPLRGVPLELEVADLDGDGTPDLVTRAGLDVVVLLRDPAGGFAGRRVYPIVSAGWASGLQVGDVDGDGRADVLSVGNETVRLLRNAGGGKLLPVEAVATGIPVWSMALGELDGDGSLDLVTLGSPPPGQGVIAAHLGDGSGGFGRTTRLSLGATIQGLDPADLDGDGRDEVLAVGSSLLRIVLRAGELALDGPIGPYVGVLDARGDFDGDGHLDLAIAQAIDDGSAAVALMPGSGDGHLRDVVGSARGFSAGIHTLHDVDRDGLLDALGWPIWADRVEIARGEGEGRFAEPLSVRTPPVFSDLFVGDFDGDGRDDLALKGFAPTSVTILRGQGDLRFAPGQTLPLPQVESYWMEPTPAVAGDIDGDGRLELVLRAPARNALVVIGADAHGAPVVEGWIETVSGVGPVTTRDVDGDGRDDVLYLRQDAGAGTSLWFFDHDPGAGLGPPSKLLDLPLSWVPGSRGYPWSRALELGDLDGDGREDVLAWRDVGWPWFPIASVSQVAAWSARPAGGFTPLLDERVTGAWRIGHGDLDGDGRQEIAFGLQGPIGSCVAIWRWRAGLSAPQAERYSMPAALLADVDGDGTLDAIGSTGAAILTYLNRGGRSR